MYVKIKNVIGVVFVLYILKIIFPFVMMFFTGDIEKPKITYGEFPFKLTYEINDEIKVIEDILICEYDGVKITSNGKRLKWKSYCLNSDEEDSIVTIYSISNDEKIFYFIGEPSYFMGKAERRNYSTDDIFSAYIYEYEYGGFLTKRIIKADELKEQYNIKIISFECSEPIKNSFK